MSALKPRKCNTYATFAPSECAETRKSGAVFATGTLAFPALRGPVDLLPTKRKCNTYATFGPSENEETGQNQRKIINFYFLLSPHLSVRKPRNRNTYATFAPSEGAEERKSGAVFALGTHGFPALRGPGALLPSRRRCNTYAAFGPSANEDTGQN